ncbi:MAG: T9SS type A sorting domain-containing protein [candidate division Zixibacteria bacterium]|nr:T9SS type A sorting domain-containing protein [candidate division Zixibacteria bacterium]
MEIRRKTNTRILFCIFVITFCTVLFMIPIEIYAFGHAGCIGTLAACRHTVFSYTPLGNLTGEFELTVSAINGIEPNCYTVYLEWADLLAEGTIEDTAGYQYPTTVILNDGFSTSTALIISQDTTCINHYPADQQNEYYFLFTVTTIYGDIILENTESVIMQGIALGWPPDNYPTSYNQTNEVEFNVVSVPPELSDLMPIGSVFGTLSGSIVDVYMDNNDTCLFCTTINHSPRVPREDGTIQWDLTVTNCGIVPIAPVIGEIIPTNIDCFGPQYDFNLTKTLVPNLAPGSSFTGYYYYKPGTVSNPFVDVALWNYMGLGTNNYLGCCCFEFIFTTAWGRGEGSTWGENGEWGLRDDIIPMVPVLNQNYPNPFNAATTILFDVAEAGYVNLSVYNLAGQLIDVLHDDDMGAGQHTINWNTSAFSSGVYFYKLKTGDFQQVKKMMIVK